jgi:hypothetical protein
MSTEHTPTPWIVDESDQDFDQIISRTEEGLEVLVADVYGDIETSKANAAFIVRACNSHDALVAVGTRIAKYFDGTSGSDFPACLPIAVIDELRAAIKLARGEA